MLVKLGAQIRIHCASVCLCPCATNCRNTCVCRVVSCRVCRVVWCGVVSVGGELWYAKACAATRVPCRGRG
jgi:hypothetical protein